MVDCGFMDAVHGSGLAAFLKLSSALPPELLCQEPVSPANDLYSSGRLLLFRLTGNIEREPRLRQEIPGWGLRLTLELERIVSKALQPDPRRRFHAAAAFGEDPSIKRMPVKLVGVSSC
jgi:hypothetical protein